MDKKLLLIVFALISQLHLSFAGKVKSLESVPDLENAMYLTVEGYPCVRLLNLSGEIGCANPGRGKVVAPIVRFKSANDKLALSSTFLVSSDEMKSFFVRLLPWRRNTHSIPKGSRERCCLLIIAAMMKKLMCQCFLVCIARMLIKKDLYRISCGDPSYPLLELLLLLLFTKWLRPLSVIFGRRLEEII